MRRWKGGIQERRTQAKKTGRKKLRKKGRKETWKRGFCVEGMSEVLNEGSKKGWEVEMKIGVIDGNEGIN